MKAILLTRVDRAKIAKALLAIRGAVYVTSEVSREANEAVKFLDSGSKNVNPFDVFEPHEKQLIVEALEYTAAAYRSEGDTHKEELAKRFDAIVRQAKMVGEES